MPSSEKFKKQVIFIINYSTKFNVQLICKYIRTITWYVTLINTSNSDFNVKFLITSWAIHINIDKYHNIF